MTTPCCSEQTPATEDEAASEEEEYGPEDPVLPSKGVDYLGLGYDMVFGNPQGDPILQIDPGFKVPAAKVSWDGSHLTGDWASLAPQNGYQYSETSCSRASSATEIDSMSD